MSRKELKSFLIINPFGIGDVLFSTPLIRAVADAFPGSRIYYMCNRKTEPVLRNHPLIAKTFIYHRSEFVEAEKKSLLFALKKYNGFIAEIRRERIACSLDLSLGTPFSLFAMLAGIPRRLGLDFKHRGKFLTRRIAINGFAGKHVADHYLDILGLLGCPARRTPMELVVDPAARRWAEDFLASSRASTRMAVAIAPGGGNSWGNDAHLKHWGIENFAALAGRILAAFECDIFIVGDAGDKSRAVEMCHAVAGPRIHDYTGSTSLVQLAALLEKCSLVIANDGGPLHMAQALGRRAIGIFGPVSEVVYGAYPEPNEKLVIIKKDMDCRPCYNNFRLDRHCDERRCLNAIQVGDVFAAAVSLLESGERVR